MRYFIPIMMLGIMLLIAGFGVKGSNSAMAQKSSTPSVADPGVPGLRVSPQFTSPSDSNSSALTSNGVVRYVYKSHWHRGYTTHMPRLWTAEIWEITEDDGDLLYVPVDDTDIEEQHH